MPLHWYGAGTRPGCSSKTIEWANMVDCITPSFHVLGDIAACVLVALTIGTSSF